MYSLFYFFNVLIITYSLFNCHIFYLFVYLFILHIVYEENGVGIFFCKEL